MIKEMGRERQEQRQKGGVREEAQKEQMNEGKKRDWVRPVPDSDSKAETSQKGKGGDKLG